MLLRPGPSNELPWSLVDSFLCVSAKVQLMLYHRIKSHETLIWHPIAWASCGSQWIKVKKVRSSSPRCGRIDIHIPRLTETLPDWIAHFTTLTTPCSTRWILSALVISEETTTIAAGKVSGKYSLSHLCSLLQALSVHSDRSLQSPEEIFDLVL